MCVYIRVDSIFNYEVFMRVSIITDSRPMSLDWASHKELHSKDNAIRLHHVGKHHTLKMNNQNIQNNEMLRLPSGQLIRNTKTNSNRYTAHDRNVGLNDSTTEDEKYNGNPRSTISMSKRHRKGKQMWYPEYKNTKSKGSGTNVRKINVSSIIEMINSSIKEEKAVSLPRRKSIVITEVINGVKVTVITPKRYV